MLKWMLAGLVVLAQGFIGTNAMAAKGFGCDGVAGAVIFNDTLYGGATGLVISGLVLLAKDDTSDAGKTISQGTLIGAGLGLGLGIAEVALRDCSEPSRQGGKLSSQPSLFAMQDGTGFGWQFQYWLEP